LQPHISNSQVAGIKAIAYNSKH